MTRGYENRPLFYKVMIKNILRFKLCAVFLAFVVGFCLLLGKPNFFFNARGPKIISLSSSRWLSDLDDLEAVSDLNILRLPESTVQRIYDFFPLKKVNYKKNELIWGNSPLFHYYWSVDQALLQNRLMFREWLQVFGKVLKYVFNYRAVISPAIHYRTEQELASAFDSIDLPFIAFHKEFTLIDDEHIAFRREVYKKTNTKFRGTAIGVVNERAKELFVSSNVAHKEQVYVTGLIRVDNLLSPSMKIKSEMSKVVTLFSFGHYSGNIVPVDRKSHYFSNRDDDGFVSLFRKTHLLFVKTAIESPEVKFFIKLKNSVDWWIEEVESLIISELGMPLADIPNIEISTDDAQTLIKKSDVIVGFNSTVVIEAIASNTPCIIPMFAEARHKLSHHVYFKKFSSSLCCPKSTTEFVEDLRASLIGKRCFKKQFAIRKEFLSYYVGNADGRSAQRAAILIKKHIN